MAADRIRAALDSNAAHLNLGGCLLRTLPPNIGGLSSVRTIQLSGNALVSLPESISRLIDRGCQVWNVDISALPRTLNPSSASSATLPTNPIRRDSPPRNFVRERSENAPPAGSSAVTTSESSNGRRRRRASDTSMSPPSQITRRQRLQEGEGTSESSNDGTLNTNSTGRVDAFHSTLHAWESDPNCGPSELRSIAADRIRAALDSNAAHLNLGGCLLRTLPPNIGGLSSVRTIQLSGNALVSLPESISRLHSDCQIWSVDASRIAEEEIRRLQQSAGPRIQFHMASSQNVGTQQVPGTPRQERLSSVWASSSRHPIPSSRPVRDSHAGNTLVQAIRPWISEELFTSNLIEQVASWNSEENSSSFRTLLIRLGETAEAADVDARNALNERVTEALLALNESELLRETCFAIAEEALGTCGDRVALGFSYVEDAIINYRAEEGQLSTSDLLNLGKQKFRQSIVEALAREKARTVPRADEIEVHLAFQVMLKGKLDLPSKTGAMLYSRVSEVTEEDVATAVSIVNGKEFSQDMEMFLCAYTPWLQHLKRSYSSEFETALQPTRAEMEEFSTIPDDMTEGEYILKCKSLQDQLSAAETQTAVRLTKPFFLG